MEYEGEEYPQGADDNPTHFHGLIPNSSNTPRNEVGGLALFDGVMMRSRTGFAIAIRRPDGLIHLKQVPLRPMVERGGAGKIPLLRGALSLWEMMVIGTKALRDSARDEEPAPADPSDESRRMGVLLALSMGVLVLLLVVLPTVISAGVPWLAGVTGLINPETAASFNKLDTPLLVNFVESALRLILVVAYLAVISLDGEVRRVFQYHGAEHKAVLALEEGRDVTVDRARRQDTLHPRCGTTFLALVVLMSIVFFYLSELAIDIIVPAYDQWSGTTRRLAGAAVHTALLPFIIGGCFELVRMAAKRMRNPWWRLLLKPGFLLQRMTTRHPNDKQLEVAIVALFGALAIPVWQREPREWVVRGLEDDESAPGYVQRSPARPAPAPGTPDAPPTSEAPDRPETSTPHGRQESSPLSPEDAGPA